MARGHEFQEQGVRDYNPADYQLPPNDARMRSLSRTATPLSLAQLISEALKALKRQSDFIGISQVIPVGVPTLVLSASARTYLILQNNSTGSTLFVGVGFQPNSTFGIQLIAGGSYEPFQVPQGDIWLNCSVADCAVTILYASDILPDNSLDAYS